MKRFSFKKIDAFATINSDGNPAGYISLESLSDISSQEMQQIAKEMKGFVNEVGFIAQTSESSFDLKYYSSEREVDFCGHATIAIFHNLLKENTDLQKFESIRIKTNRGILQVVNRIEHEDAVFILSPVPERRTMDIDKKSIADNLKIPFDTIDDMYPISIIDAGLVTLLVPINDLQAILDISPDLETLKDFCMNSNIDIIEVFTHEVVDKSNDYRTRVFAPTFGYLEDTATGSGNSAFGYYLIEKKEFNKNTIMIEQNGFRDRFNIIKLQKGKDENGVERVYFGGGSITRLNGEYYLY